MDVWESYAVFERFGTSFGHCTFDGPAKSSPDIWIKWKERINQGQGSATARCISWTFSKISPICPAFSRFDFFKEKIGRLFVSTAMKF